MKAVIPAAGLGTRFLPATKNSPKEMLPVVDKPAIQYVVEECVASGIREILLITGRGKRTIEDHFDRSFELEALLAKKGDKKKLEEVRAIAEMADITYVRQKEALGLGHAVSCAANYVGDEPFALLLGDDIVVSKTPCMKQLMQRHERWHRSVIAVERVAPEETRNYGMVELGPSVEPGLFTISDLVEKPEPKDAPSDLGIMGRYVLTPEIFDALRRTKPGKNKEIQLTDALNRLRKEQGMYAHKVDGKRYDLGDKLKWLVANLELGLRNGDIGTELRSHVRRLASGK